MTIRVEDKVAFTKKEFCERNSISITTFNKLRKQGRGPRLMVLEVRPLISIEAERDWRADMEKYATSEAVKLAAQRRSEHNKALGKLSLQSPEHIVNRRRARRRAK